MRMLLRFAAGAAFAMLLAQSPALAALSQAVLKANIVVEGDKVMLGDLFDASVFAQAPDAAQVPILAAPRPGESLSLDALALQRFAQLHGIDWPNAQGLTAIRIERTGAAITSDVVDKAVLDGLSAHGLPGRLGLRYSSALPTLYVASGSTPSLSIEKMSVDPATGQFTASLRAPAGDPRGATAQISGRAYGITELPVTVRDIKPGETISERDIVLVDTPSEKLGQNVLTSETDLVGMAPKRMIRAGDAVRLGDIEPPILVKKDAVVIMTMRAPGMTLTAEGRALQNGAAGDTIKVVNTSSKRTVSATVEGEGLVLVGGPAPPTLAANLPPTAPNLPVSGQ